MAMPSMPAVESLEARRLFAFVFPPGPVAGLNTDFLVVKTATPRVWPGEKVREAVMVTNGSAAPGTSVITGVSLYLSDDGHIDPSDRLITTKPLHKSLRPGGSTTVRFKGTTYPTDLPQGQHFLLARLDEAEPNPQSYNVAVVSRPVMSYAADVAAREPPTFDTRVFHVPQGAADTGRDFVSVPVSDYGTQAFKGSVELNLYAGSARDLIFNGASGPNGVLIGTLRTTLSLKHGRVKKVKVPIAVPPGTTSGDFDMLVTVTAADASPQDTAYLSGVRLV